jgi:hypothetical protein
MANKHWIVVWDPTNEYWDGSLVDGNRARQLEARGVALLPVNPELFKLAGVGGFAKRSWGAGWPLDYQAPRMACPLTLYCLKEKDFFLHWCARIAPDPAIADKVDEGGKFNGFLRLAADSSQGSALHVGLQGEPSPIDIRELGRRDVHGGWTVGGNAIVRPVQDGFYNFALYGNAQGFRVVWVAASLSAE